MVPTLVRFFLLERAGSVLDTFFSWPFTRYSKSYLAVTFNLLLNLIGDGGDTAHHYKNKNHSETTLSLGISSPKYFSSFPHLCFFLTARSFLRYKRLYLKMAETESTYSPSTRVTNLN